MKPSISLFTPIFLIVVVTAVMGLFFVACGPEHGDHSSDSAQYETVFWSQDIVSSDYYLTTAKLMGSSRHARFYLETDAKPSVQITSNLIGEIGRKFDAIYERATSVFGSEPKPGVDGDYKIIILLLDIRDGFNPDTSKSYVAGFFASRDLFTREQLDEMNDDSKTNEHEMIYLDINPGKPGTDTFLRTLAHEFTHMISFNQKTMASGLRVYEQTWLDESMAMLAEEITGLPPYYPRVLYYLNEPDFGFYQWKMDIRSYAVAYMWAKYLFDRFYEPTGGKILSDIVRTPADGHVRAGIGAVEYGLQQNGIDMTFDDLFRDWNLAVLLGSLGESIDPYTYSDLDLLGTYDKYQFSGVTMTDNPDATGALNPWCHRFAKFDSIRKIAFDAVGSAKAVLYDGAQVVSDVESGKFYDIDSTAYFCIRNSSAESLEEAGIFETQSSKENESNEISTPPTEHFDDLMDRLIELSGGPVSIDVGPMMRKIPGPASFSRLEN